MYLFKHTKRTPFVKPRGFGQSGVYHFFIENFCNLGRFRGFEIPFSIKILFAYLTKNSRMSQGMNILSK